MIDQCLLKVTNYRRYRLKGGCYFFTVALAERLSRLLTDNVQPLRAGFRSNKPTHLRWRLS